MTDHLPVYYFDPPPPNELSDSHGLEIILEPIQKWSCPDELVNQCRQFNESDLTLSSLPSFKFYKIDSCLILATRWTVMFSNCQ